MLEEIYFYGSKSKTQYGVRKEDKDSLLEIIDEDVMMVYQKPFISFGVDWQDKSMIYLDFLFVPENLRGSGLGKRLVQSLIEKCRNDPKINMISLITLSNSDIDLEKFYQSLGFKNYNIKSDYEMFIRV